MILIIKFSIISTCIWTLINQLKNCVRTAGYTSDYSVKWLPYY